MHASEHKVVFRLSAMGDVALLTGPLNWWRERRGLSFTVCTRQELAPLFAGHPAVAAVEGLVKDQLHGAAWLRTARELAARYAGSELLDMHGTTRSRVLSRLWRGPVRRYPKYSLERRLYGRLRFGWAGRRLARTSVTQRYMLALESTVPPAAELLPRVWLTDAERFEAEAMLRALLEQGRPLAALHPFATHANKAWPADRWPALADALEEAGWDWFVVGVGESPLLQAGKGGPERDFVNRSSLRIACALLERAQVLVTADSGPMHLAAAVGTPVTALFGPTNRAWGFFPQGERDTVLELDLACRPCSLHGRGTCRRGLQCMADIPVERVRDAVVSYG